MINSLSRSLLMWLLIPLLAVALFNVWTTYKTASEVADLRSDQSLLGSARNIAESIRVIDGIVESPIPPSALESFASDTPDIVAYSVTTGDGKLVAGNPTLTAPTSALHSLGPIYFKTVFRGLPVRAVGLSQPLIAASGDAHAFVIVAQTQVGHDRLVRSLWVKSLRDQALLIIFAGGLALYGLTRGLGPLNALGREIMARDARNLSPVDTKGVQRELRPLVGALNGAFAKVEGQVASQRRFVANAAHQLRTPLAVLKTQAQVGLRASETTAKDEALASIATSIGTMSRLVTQLLSLARAEQGHALLHKERVNMAEVVREAVEASLPQSFAKEQDLGVEAGNAPIFVFGHANLLRELVLNLIDNALRYSPSKSSVTVRLSNTEKTVVISVEDAGPGIAEPARLKAFDRFERTGTKASDGNGLGLAIVREITGAHQGQVELSERVPPPGLVVRVTLPAFPA